MKTLMMIVCVGMLCVSGQAFSDDPFAAARKSIEDKASMGDSIPNRTWSNESLGGEELVNKLRESERRRDEELQRVEQEIKQREMEREIQRLRDLTTKGPTGLCKSVTNC